MPEKKKLDLIVASTYSLKDVELARVGKYSTSTGPWNVTDVVINDMVRNFSSTDPIPGNQNHDPNDTHGKAQGQITKVWMKEWVDEKGKEITSIFSNIDKIPESMKEALDNGEFFTRSVEAYKDKENGWTLDGFAWLGAKRPAMKHMQPLGELTAAESDSKPTRIYCDSDGTCHTGQFEYITPIKDMEVETKMDGSVKSEFEKQIAANNAAAEKRESDMKAEIAEAKAESKKAAESAASSLTIAKQAQFDARKAEADKKFDDLIRAGKMTPAMRETIEDAYIQCSCDEVAGIKVKAASGEGEDRKESEVSLTEAFDLFFASMPKMVEFEEITGHGEQTKQEDAAKDGSDLDAQVDKLMAEGKSRDEAVDIVSADASEQGR